MKKLYLLLFSFVLLGCQESEDSLYVLQGNAFGTTYTVQYYANSELVTPVALDSVFDRVNQSVSTYLPTSDISKINAGDSTVVVDELFRAVYQLSETVYQQSDGYFDPTVGVLRNAYGFGEEKPLERMDQTQLDSLRQFVGFDKVELRDDHTIYKQHPEIYFDFNAVAKGYGIDLMGDYLNSLGITDYLIELGGELLAAGINLNKEKAWVAGIENVDSSLADRSYGATVSLYDQAMASSGNYRKFRIDSLTGKKYVHTINPLTGEAQQSDVTSATIIAQTCGWADAYATACMAMGLERSIKLLGELEAVEGYLTYNDSLGNHQVFVTEGFGRAPKSLATDGN